MGVIPIVNENDTLAVAEIKFGDNDTLSAITSAMVHADYLFLMTDVDCLYDKNPRTHPDAQPIEVVQDIGAIQADGRTDSLRLSRNTAQSSNFYLVSSAGSSLGTGGMGTKIVAAQLATAAGVTTVITRSSNPGNIFRIVRYLQAHKATATPAPLNHAEDTSDTTTTTEEKPPLHTRFLPLDDPIRDRYFWLMHGLAPRGTLYIDEGAHAALADKAGLLPVGVLDVEGHFGQHEAVRVVVAHRLPEPNADGRLWDGEPHEVGRALVNYAAPEVARIKGRRSSQIGPLLGYADSEYVAFRENITLFRRESRSASPTPPESANGAVTPAGS